MQVQRIAVAGATVLSLLAWSTGSAAETEPDAVRQLLAEMEKLKERVSRLERENRGMRETNETQAQRIQQLEADVQEQQRLAEQREAAEGEDPAALEADAEAELEELRQLFVELKERVEAESPADKRDAALERVEELEESIVAEEPDLTTMEYVKRWFGKNLPGLAGAVTSIVVHPIVGKLVEVAGDALAAEFRRRFGGG